MSLQEAIAEADLAKSATQPQQPVGLLLPGASVAVVLLGIAVVIRGCFSGSDDPFRYMKVSGKVCYEDGSLIPAKRLVVTFIPAETVSENKKFARPGLATVDDTTGEFRSATTRKPNDGIVFGRHRVVLSVSDREPLPDDVVPAVYKDQTKSPLEVDTRKQPFDIRIARPQKR
jgi:hypothetical protein